MPSCWCQWILTKKKTTKIRCEINSARFVNYEFWLQYVIDFIVQRNNQTYLTISGEIFFSGESINDNGILKVVKRDRDLIGGPFGVSSWQVEVHPKVPEPLFAKRPRKMTKDIMSYFNLRPNFVRRSDVAGYMLIVRKDPQTSKLLRCHVAY